MAAVVNSFAISGVDGYVVEIEVDTLFGQPSITVVGLGDRVFLVYMFTLFWLTMECV